MNNLQYPSPLPWDIDLEKFSLMRYLVPVMTSIHLILLLIFILHLLFPYATVDALVFALFNLGIMAYVTLVAMDMLDPNDTDGISYQWGFYVWIGAASTSALVLFFVIIMCCTGCHF